MWGEQWTCHICKWHNFTLRIKCRRCGTIRDMKESKTETWQEIVRNLPKERTANPWEDIQ